MTTCSICKREVEAGDLQPDKNGRKKTFCKHCHAVRRREWHRQLMALQGRYADLKEVHRRELNRELRAKGERWCPACARSRPISDFERPRSIQCLECQGADTVKRARIRRNKQLAKEGLKECKTCGTVKPASEFSLIRPGTLSPSCRACRRKPNPKKGPYKVPTSTEP